VDERPQFREDVNRLRRRRELEEKRLQQDDRGDNSADPTKDQDYRGHWPAHSGDDLGAHDRETRQGGGSDMNRSNSLEEMTF